MARRGFYKPRAAATSALPECSFESDGHDFFVIFDGAKIAKRGQPGTPQAGQWISLEPGFAVYGGGDAELVVELGGVRLQ
jgi:hypothetical protein